jgi:hypothetical protein
LQPFFIYIHGTNKTQNIFYHFTATSLAEDVAFKEAALLNATSLTGDVAKKEVVLLKPA